MCKNKLGEPVYLIILLFLLCNVSHAGFETNIELCLQMCIGEYVLEGTLFLFSFLIYLNVMREVQTEPSVEAVNQVKACMLLTFAVDI